MDSHGKIWWSELNTHQPEEAVAHYTSLYGWVFTAMPMEDGSTYHLAMQGEQPVAGVFDMRAQDGMKDLPSHWMTYIAHDDVDAACKEVHAQGGQIIRAPFDVPDTGRIAIVSDPVGAAIGIMTPAPMAD